MTRNPRILIVEDEYLIRLTMAEALADAGFDVIEAVDGDEAAGLLRSGSGFDLILTDLQLPGGMRGEDVAQLARAAAPKLPVIFVTGRAVQPDHTRSQHDLVIAKPCLPSEVCAAALRLLAVGQAPENRS